MPLLYAPAGRVGVIHSRNNPDKTYHIDGDGRVRVGAHDDISDLIAAGFSHSPIPKAAAAAEDADVAEMKAQQAADHADEMAEHAKHMRELANKAHEDARSAHARMAEDVENMRRQGAQVDRDDPAGRELHGDNVYENVHREVPDGATLDKAPEAKPAISMRVGMKLKSDNGDGVFHVKAISEEGRIEGTWDDGKDMTYSPEEISHLHEVE